MLCWPSFRLKGCRKSRQIPHLFRTSKRPVSSESHRHMQVAWLAVLLTGLLIPPTPQGIFIRGWVARRARERPEGLYQRKPLITPLGNEPASFRSVAQCLYNLRHCILHMGYLLFNSWGCFPAFILEMTIRIYRGHIYIYIYIYIYIGCPRRNVPDFGRVFLVLKYTDINPNTYIQSWTVTEIMAREVWNFDSCYTLIDYRIHIKTGRNMWFL